MLPIFVFGAILPSVARADFDDYSLTIVLQNSPFFPPGGWVPMRVEMRNQTNTAGDGYVEVPVINESGGVTFRLPVRSPPHTKVTATAYGYFAAPAPQKDKSLGTPPLTTAAWYTGDGQRLNRTPMLGQPIGSNPGGGTMAEASNYNGTTLLLTIQGDASGDSRDAYDTYGFGKFLSNMLGVTVGPAFLSQEYAPRNRVGFFPCRIVCFDTVVADQLDMSQRIALIDYLTGGGILVLAAPLGGFDPSNSWLAPYFPVQTIGKREAKHVDGRLRSGSSGGGGSDVKLKLPEALEICEAVPGDGEVVMADGNYVHAAYKRVGLGRVVFVSFPINALDPNDDNANRLWRDLIAADVPTTEWQQTQLAEQRVRLLESMIGKPTVAWKKAAGVAGGYLILMVLIQAFAGTARRPGAFATGMFAAAGISLVLVTLTLAQRRDERLVGARLATLDLAPGGGGIQREAFTYLGKDEPDLNLTTVRQDVTIRPIIASADNSPVVWLHPFIVPRADVHAAKMDRVWQADGVLPTSRAVEAWAMFGPDGLRVTIDNRLGQTLRAPLLVWGGEQFRLGEMNAGATEHFAGNSNRNLHGDFTNASVLASQMQHLRGQILQYAVTPPAGSMFSNFASSPPEIAAWIDDAPSLVQTSGADSPPDMRSQSLARVPVELRASPVGSKVRIDGAFTRIDVRDARGLPYDVQKHEWISSPQEGQYLFCFAPPPQVGAIRPTHATIDLNVQAPRHEITILRGQCAGGTPRENAAGREIAKLSHPIGASTYSFDCDASDYDAAGRVWLFMKVENQSVGDALASSWQFRQFELGIEADVTGPPIASATTRPAALGAPAPRVPSAQPGGDE